MLAAAKRFIDNHNFLHKLFHWEYWPVWTVYWPVFIYWVILSIRERSLFFFMATNPGMENGGLFGVSKMSINDKLPSAYLPVMRLLYPDHTEAEVKAWLAENGLQYPLFLKPDVGERGLEVTRIEHYADIRRWFSAHPVMAILQEAIIRPVEVGLLYYRIPGETKGYISSFMLREMLTMTGDGVHTLAQLIEASPRARLQKERMQKKFTALWDNILPEGEQIILEHVGNHNRGTTFININHLICDQLLQVFDNLSHQVKDGGIYFGRYDIKCDSIEDLIEGKNFTIIELNGVASEPAHIYDPDFKLLEAYKVVLRQWKVIHTISRKNHQLGIAYLPVKEGFARLQKYRAHIAAIKSTKIN